MGLLQPFAVTFDTETEVKEAMISKYVNNCLLTHKAYYYSRTSVRVYQNREPTVLYTNFQRKKILLRHPGRNSEPQLNDAKYELVIIDWKWVDGDAARRVMIAISALLTSHTATWTSACKLRSNVRDGGRDPMQHTVAPFHLVVLNSPEPNPPRPYI